MSHMGAPASRFWPATRARQDEEKACDRASDVTDASVGILDGQE